MKSTCRVLFFFVSSLLLAFGSFAPHAWAKPDRVAVVRVATAEVDLRPLAERLTDAVAGAVKQQGYDVEVTEVALGTIKTMLACESLTVCLRQLGDTLGAKVVVAGQLTKDESGDGATLTLLWVTDGDVYRDRFDIGSGESAELVAGKMTAFARQEPFEAVPAEEPEAGDDAGAGDRDDLVATEPEAPRGGLDLPRKTWLWGGGGLASVAVGALFLQSARSRQDDIDSAPTGTVADLEALRDEEAAARRYSIVGTTLLVAGGAALVTGAIYAVRHKRAREEPSTAFTVSTPEGSPGSGLMLGWRASL